MTAGDPFVLALGDSLTAGYGLARHESLAAAHAVPVHPFFPPGVLGHHAHVLRDRLHPNALAIDKVARSMAPVVQAIWLGRSRQAGA